MKSAELTKFTEELDEGEYFLNADGEPEMTKTAQEEYDAFIAKAHEAFTEHHFYVIDEGFGEGEDELEYHLTAAVKDDAGAPRFHKVIEMLFVVRASEEKE